jgi:signal transduction histidine kinase
MFTNIDGQNQDTTKSIGIALNVSEQIVRAMGGEIGFKSSKGIGSQFSFSIVLDKIIDKNEMTHGHSFRLNETP